MARGVQQIEAGGPRPHYQGTRQGLQAEGYVQTKLKPGEQMPPVPTADVIKRYPGRNLPDGLWVARRARLERRAKIADKIPSALVPDHTLLDTNSSPLWAWPHLMRTESPEIPNLGYRERQKGELAEVGRHLFMNHPDNIAFANERSQQDLAWYQQRFGSYNPNYPEGKTITTADKINAIADGDAAATDELLAKLDAVKRVIPQPLVEVMKKLGAGIKTPIKLPGSQEPLGLPSSPALAQLGVLLDTQPDSSATVAAARAVIQNAVAAGRNALVNAEALHQMHETELREHPERNRGHLRFRAGVRVAKVLAPYGATYLAAVVLPPVEGPMARVAESVAGKYVIGKAWKSLKGRSSDIVDLVGNMVADAAAGKGPTRTMIATMEFIMKIAGYDMTGAKDQVPFHTYFQYGLAHPEEFAQTHRAVVLDQMYRDRSIADAQAMREITRGGLLRFGRERRARRIVTEAGKK